MATRIKRYSLRMTDMTDREVLAIVNHHADNDGFTDTSVIAQAIWPKSVNSEDGFIQAVSAIGSRLSWMMRKADLVTKYLGTPKPQYSRWTLTNRGHALLAGRLSATIEKNLDHLDGTKAVLAAERISMLHVSEVDLALMKRAWIFGIYRRGL